MKAVVITTFRDKLTRVVHKKGQEIEVTPERFEEINSTALGAFVRVTDVAAKPKKEKATKKAGG